MKDNNRRGSTLVECVVAAGMVLAMLMVAAPTVVRVGRIWKQTTHHQLACDELNAQLDRLIALPSEQRESAIKSLAVDDAVAEVLHDARLVATVTADDVGKRIELTIDWERVGDPPPIKLTGWITPFAEESENESAEPTEDAS